MSNVDEHTAQSSSAELDANGKPKPKWKQTLAKTHDKAFQASDRLGVKVTNTSHKFKMESFWPGPMVGEVQKAARILASFTTLGQDGQPGGKKRFLQISPRMIQEAEGLCIYTTFRSGIHLSGAGGSGIVIARNPDRTWGGPSGVLIHTIGLGLLAGADIYNIVLVLRTRKAVNAFTHAKVSLGGEGTITVGSASAGAAVDTGIEASPVVSYARGKGLYGGLQLDLNIILSRKDENARFYGRSKITSKEILTAGSDSPALDIPAAVGPLHAAIAQAERIESVVAQYGPSPDVVVMHPNNPGVYTNYNQGVQASPFDDPYGRPSGASSSSPQAARGPSEGGYPPSPYPNDKSPGSHTF